MIDSNVTSLRTVGVDELESVNKSNVDMYSMILLTIFIQKTVLEFFTKLLLLL